MSLNIIKDPKAHCSVSKQFTYRIEWLPERQYVAGTQFEIRSHRMRAFNNWCYSRFWVENGDITFRWKLNPSVSEKRENSDRILFRAFLPYGARKGKSIEMEITASPSTFADVNNILSLWTIDVVNNFRPNDPLPLAEKEADSECTLTLVAGPVERLSVYSRPMANAKGEVRTVIVPEDRFGNPAKFDKPQQCKLTWLESVMEIQVQETEIFNLPAPTKTARATLSIPMQSLTAKENIANGQRDGKCMIVTGNPVWSETSGKMKPAFGEFHWHTDISGDGQRPISEALHCAKDYLNMDFVAPGDHNPGQESWAKTIIVLDKFNNDDEFVTFFGWENGSDRGHENYYFTNSDHPLICGGSAGLKSERPVDTIDKLRDLYGLKDDFIVIPHHTNSVAETRKIEDDTPFWHPYPWSEPEEYIRLIEIFQTRGNQEKNIYDDAWRGWHQNNGSSVQDALALGYKTGFTGGTDNHSGWPGRAFAECEGGGKHPQKSVILTGIWTKQLQRQNVFDSLKSRHTWAVWDTRALVQFSINGAMAGDEITVETETDITAHIRMSAEDALQTVEIVSEGKIVWQSSFDEMDIDIDIPLGLLKKATHYYLRALQRNGAIIYASPVFVITK